jgi:hypothetical protein
VTFLSERIIKVTRRAHVCEGCGQTIPASDPAYNWRGVDDYFMSAYYHPDCREAEVKLNDLWDRNSDEWMCLQDRDREDHAWILAEYPAVAERLNIQPEKTS